MNCFRGAGRLAWSVESWAASESTARLVKALLASGADPTAKTTVGKTALDDAVQRGDPEIISMLQNAVETRSVAGLLVR